MKLIRTSFISWLVTAFVGVIFLLMVYETWAVFTGNETITAYARSAVHQFPGWAFAVAILVGAALGHFLWGPATGPCSPVSDGDQRRRGRYAD